MLEKLFLQKNYADQVGFRLEKFRVQAYSPYRANFRCPICGDSQKNKFKKRGFFLEENSKIFFYCHNECGSIGFEKFLELYHSDLYSQYRFDIFQSLNQSSVKNIKSNDQKVIEPTIVKVDNLEGLIPILETNKPLEYLKNRLIPEKYFSDIYYTSHFFKFINDKMEGKFSSFLNDKPNHRIVLPLRDFNGEIFGVVGRALDKKDENRYLTIKFDETKPKIYGLDRISLEKHGYVSEGPIDSLFIENCVALAGTDGNPLSVFKNTSDFTMILDNQPRNKSALKKYEKYIRMGCSIFIWPSHIIEKDINDWILSGANISEINSILKLNTYSGLQLEIMFNQWRKL